MLPARARTQSIYDAEGNRVARGTPAGWPASGSTCNAPTSGNGFSLTSADVLGLGGEQFAEVNGAASWLHTNIFADGKLLATYSGSDTTFALTDWLGTKRVEVATNGDVSSNFSLPFGNGLSSTGNAPDATEHHFTGKERDAESGNDYFGARYYASTMGRFMSPDPGWYRQANPVNPQTWNQYSYVLNSPLRFTDPSGMECVWDDGSYDAADDPQTGNAAGCSSQGGTYVNPDLFENAVLTNGQNANIQYSSWSGQANSTTASSWTTPSSITSTTDDGTLLNAVQNSLGAVQQNGFYLQGVQNYTAMDVFNWAATGNHTPNGCASGVVGCLYHYGHWCGAGGSGAPTDTTDAACLVHDFFYAQYGFTAGSNYNGYNPALQEINQGLCDTRGSGAISAYFGFGVATANAAMVNWTGNASCK